MTITMHRMKSTSSLLARMIDRPDLVAVVQGMTAPEFVAMVSSIGVEDAGPLVAAATTEQLVAAFDEELFRNEQPGERETFDPERFATWLEVLLEAGDAQAAHRLSELSEDFLLRGFSSLVHVLDHDALRNRMLAVDEDESDAADAVDKALESSHVHEIDGYLLVSREGKGWDATIALLVALDRDHRALLERLLDRAARKSARLIRDFEGLHDVLSEAESLAEDVEAERDARRAAEGFVEPRAARSFLTLARAPFSTAERDVVTKAYFRALKGAQGGLPAPAAALPAQPSFTSVPLPLLGPGEGLQDQPQPILIALRALRDETPRLFLERVEELTYLANVLLAGASGCDGARLTPAEAAQAALATVAFGAEVAAGASVDVPALSDVLARESADALFRRASAALAANGGTSHLGSLSELVAARAATRGKKRRIP